MSRAAGWSAGQCFTARAWATLRDRSHARDGDLRSELRPRRQAADRAAEDGRRQQVPADLDRPPRGGGDPDEAAGSADPPPDDPRPALRHARGARCAVHEGVGHRAARQHVLRLDHACRRRQGDGDRLAPSDALALAVRSGAPIFAAEEVIAESAIEFEHEVEDQEDVVNKFKEFLDQVTPEDFAGGED